MMKYVENEKYLRMLNHGILLQPLIWTLFFPSAGIATP